MKIHWINRDDDGFKVRVEHDQDLWYLSHVVSSGDYIEGKTQRKVDMGDTSKQQRVRKTFFLGVDIESVEYDPDMKSFRASGRIRKCPDEVSKGRYHSFNVQPGDEITVWKQRLSTEDVKQLEAATTPPINVVLVLVDRETARFASVTPNGYETTKTLSGEASKKAYDHKGDEDFHERVASHVVDLLERANDRDVVVASPGFWKDNVAEHIPQNHMGRVILGTVSRTDEQGFAELVKRPEVASALDDEHSRREGEAVDALLRAVGEEQACYGYMMTEEKVKIGAVETLLVAESFLAEQREKGNYSRLDTLLQKVEEMDGEVIIISSEEPMDKLSGLGGIGGILRWSE